jgi:hypothetical protein
MTFDIAVFVKAANLDQLQSSGSWGPIRVMLFRANQKRNISSNKHGYHYIGFLHIVTQGIAGGTQQNKAWSDLEMSVIDRQGNIAIMGGIVGTGSDYVRSAPSGATVNQNRSSRASSLARGVP